MPATEWANKMNPAIRAFLRYVHAQLCSFADSTRGNVAMMFAVCLIPLIAVTTGGMDYVHAMLIRSEMSDALDAAALAVGSTKNPADPSKLAQDFFNANYNGSGSPTVTTNYNSANGSVTVNASYNMPTTILKVAGQDYLPVQVSSTVVWGQTKLWAALVLDNTGSMCEPDSSPCVNDTSNNIKINTLKTASHNLLATLQQASVNPGDVMVSIVPFAKDVNVGTANVGASWIDWSNWEAQMPGNAPSGSVGPGSSCPYTSSSSYGGCLDQPGGTLKSDGVTMSTVSNVPSSGTWKGYICPGSIKSSSSGQSGHYYNGCWNSTPSQTLTTVKTDTQPMKDKQTCSQTGSGAITCTEQSGWPQTNGNVSSGTTTNTSSGYNGDSGPTVTTNNNQNSSNSDGTKSCSGNGNNKKCTWTRTITYNNLTITTTRTAASPYNHSWIVNNHSTWRGCVMDRDQNDDANDTTPGTKFPAENSDSCPVASVMPMSNPTPVTSSDMAAMFTSLNGQIDAMVANGGTNQTIGLAHGMQTLTSNLPYSPASLPSNTSRYIILLSDGLNTMDRWYGNGSSQSTSVDARMSAACQNAKDQGFIIYTVFVNLGSSGNSSVLQSCATDTTKYYQISTAGGIITAFNDIAQQITAVRVSH